MPKFYVATSIPYVNAEPHIGFAMELVYADVLARTAIKRGDEVLFSTGTDEHGGKIAEKATTLNQTPQAYVDQISMRFAELTKALNISNNRFIRTTDKGHEQRASLIWRQLENSIYKSQYNGWYCTGDEAFFSDTDVKANDGVCPAHNRPYEKVEEENYFFKLSSYNEEIKQAIESGSFRILPPSKKKEILSLLNSGLEDISISRPKDKISWGIPVPNDNTQVMYVWFEALLNYITVLGYPEHQDFHAFWPANVQVIGKDILRFHAAIWPAILLALKLPLPKLLYVHGFVTADGKKMSKTLGNVINPFDVIERYGVDPLRYYMMRHIPSYEDGDFSWSKFNDAYNNELANELGNLVQRTVSMGMLYFEGDIAPVPPAEHDSSAYYEALNDCRFDKALDVVWEQIRGLNQYIDLEKPWTVAKSGDQDHLREILAYLISSVREIADILEPFLPASAAKIKQATQGERLVPIEGTLFPKHEDDSS